MKKFLLKVRHLVSKLISKGGKELGLFVLIILLLAGSYVYNHNVLTLNNLQNTGRQVGIYGIMGVGMAFVIITGGIDLSIGSVISLLGVVLAILLVDKEVHPIITLLIVIGGGGLLGYVNGLTVTKIKMQPFVVTLCGLLFYRGVARFITGDQTKNFPASEKYQWLKELANGNFLGIPYPFLLLIAICVLMFFLLHKSVYGRYLFAAGYNEESARYAGIKSKGVITLAYVICGLTTGLAAVLFAFYTNSISPASHGNFYELYAIAAAVLGGCSLRGGEGSILGVFLGTMLLQVLRNLVNMLGIPSSLEFAVMGVVIFIGVLADTLLRSKRART